jgi:hypothetical protein
MQPLKAYVPILLTLSGICMEESPMQSLKASAPILVTLLGIETYLSFLRPENDELRMVVGTPMIITVSISEDELKNLKPILPGIVTCLILLQP